MTDVDTTYTDYGTLRMNGHYSKTDYFCGCLVFFVHRDDPFPHYLTTSPSRYNLSFHSFMATSSSRLSQPAHPLLPVEQWRATQASQRLCCHSSGHGWGQRLRQDCLFPGCQHHEPSGHITK